MSNKSGVSSDVISLPKGGGALQGIGETFSADLFTGTGNVTVPLAVPEGRHGLQPDLELRYSSGGGNGPFGLGWSLSVPDVSRKTSKGIPRYRDDAADPNDHDVFILSGAEDLVPVSDGAGERLYRPRTEGLFARIRRLSSAGDDVWQVETKDGLVSVYGTPAMRGSDPAVVADPADRSRVCRWLLSRTRDRFGNAIRYHYLHDTGDDGARSWDQSYLQRVEYVDIDRDGTEQFLVSVEFAYGERPDPFAAYRAGFEVRTRLRCKRVEVRTHAHPDQLVRSYELDYLDERVQAGELPLSSLPANGVSLLSRVQVVGHDSDRSEALPPLEFSYTGFNPADRQPGPIRAVGDALPPRSLAADDLELIDLFGNGLPDIVQMNGAALFWRNLGGGVFDRPQAMPEVPSGVHLEDPGVRFADLNGNGRADLLVTDSGGYFPLSFAGRWSREGFVTYEHAPTFALQSADLRLVDIDGDGVVDALLTGDDFTVFFNDPQTGWDRVETMPRRPLEEFPDVAFSSPQVKLADMSGDGLQDIVFVSRARIDYWPNLGHGRWGRRITMHASPDINDPLAPPGLGFDPDRLLFGDLDGDGVADVVYVESRRVTVWINHSGERFAEPVTIENTTLLSAPDAVRLVDAHGIGTSGLLWTSDHSGPGASHYQFLDLTGAVKPYVLAEMDNHMGAVTRMAYAPSTASYLTDEADPETSWQTPLPFPVQVLERIEIIDELSGGKLTTEYHYHHGYWDGAEREFRGFGRVDQFDTETFQDFNRAGLHEHRTFERVAERRFSPPTVTKTWFHMGPVGDESGVRMEADFAAEYWRDDPPKLERTAETAALLASLNERDRADALRSLRGSVLRQELYARDGHPREHRPHTVSETLYGLREESPAAHPSPDRRRVFFPHVLAQRATRWERGDDPMTQFTFSGDHDAFGQPRTETRISCPRGWRKPDDRPGHPYLAVTTHTVFAAPVDPDVYIGDRVASVTTHEIRSDGTEEVTDLIDASGGAVETRVIGQTLHYYDGDAFTGRPLGQIGTRGARVRSERLVLTPEILRDAYRNEDGVDVPPYLIPDGTPVATADYPQAFLDQLPALAGFAFHPGDDEHERGYFANTARNRFDFHDPSEKKRGLLKATKDPLGRTTTIDYEFFDLLPTQVTDAVGLVTRARYDPRLFRLEQMIDPNGNRTRFVHSPLGLLQSTAVMGKQGELVGDTDDTPGARFEYDYSAFDNSPQDARRPVSVRTIQRVQHAHRTDIPPPERDAVIETTEFSDGFGRLLQTRTRAEDIPFGDVTFGGGLLAADQDARPGDARGRPRSPGAEPNVVVSGATTYDNKGRVVEQFEPYFHEGFAFSPPTESQRGRKATIFYDPLGRLIRAVNPDGSERRVAFGVPGTIENPDVQAVDDFEPTPWEAYRYDPNDLAPLTTVPGSGATLGDRAPAPHHFTPSSLEVDALGRTTTAVERNGPDPSTDWFTTRCTYDIRGNPLAVTDALGRTAFRYTYDLADNPLRTENVDAGVRLVVLDAAGTIIERRDSRGALVLQIDDLLQRPIRMWARDDPDDAVTLRERLDYGDGSNLHQNPTVRAASRAANRLGALHEHYDESGRTVFQAYDFKGNVLERVREVFRDDVLLGVFDQPSPDFDVRPFRVNWQTEGDTTLEAHAATLLDPFEYRISASYDALDRIETMQYPEDATGQRTALRSRYNPAGALEHITLDGDVFVDHIAYDARGQRTLVALGNGVMTRHCYDSQSFRVARSRSERYTKADSDVPAFKHAPSPLQDLAYEYDLAGNVTTIRDRTPAAGVPNTPSGPNALDRVFTYDPIYRLLSATGRECDLPADHPPWDAGFRCTDVTRTRAYRQRYEYDPLGNMLSLRHTTERGGFVRTFDVDAGANRLLATRTGQATFQYAYDANGSLVRATDSRHFAWDHSNQLKQYRTQAEGSEASLEAHYLYDAGGQRVKKLVRKQGGDFESTTYIEGIFEHHRWKANGSRGENSHIHVMDNSRRVATIRRGMAHPDDPAPAVLYTLDDHLGSSNVVVDGEGGLVNREEYFPHGGTSFGSYARKRYRFAGKERDEESGLYNHGARYYAPSLVRWISTDPVGAVDGCNLYQYVRNNPTRLVDPQGTQAAPAGAEAGEKGSPQNRIVVDNLDGLPISPQVREGLLGGARRFWIKDNVSGVVKHYIYQPADGGGGGQADGDTSADRPSGSGAQGQVDHDWLDIAAALAAMTEDPAVLAKSEQGGSADGVPGAKGSIGGRFVQAVYVGVIFATLGLGSLAKKAWGKITGALRKIGGKLGGLLARFRKLFGRASKAYKRTPAELDDLARDAAHGGKITPKSIRERQAGLDLEARGSLPGPIKRDPSGAAEFIDANGTPWDVKAFNSNFPPKKGGFSVVDAERKVQKELARGENVILDTQDLSSQHLQQLQQLVQSRGWGNRILWWP